MRRIVQHGRIRKAGAEHEEGAEQQRENAGNEAVVCGKGNRRRGRNSHDNLRAGVGEAPPQVGRYALIVWQVSWLAASGVVQRLRVTLAFPGSSIAKDGRFVEKEASSLGLSRCHPVAFPAGLRGAVAGTIASLARMSFRRIGAPRHSTVAGSAVIAAPGLGPPRHIPIYSPIRFRIREPSNIPMIMLPALTSQLTGSGITCAETAVQPSQFQ